MNKRICIIFDFDGTLVDTSLGIYKAFVKACRHLELLEPLFEDFKLYIGPPVDKLLLSLWPNLSAHKVKEFTEHFRRYYDQKDFQYLQWYKNTYKVLLALSKRPALTLGIITNKPTAPTIKILSEEGNINFFEFIYGIDYLQYVQLGSRFNDKYEAMLYCMKTHNLQPSNCIYVGDTRSDYEYSKKAKIHFIGARYGFYNWDNEVIECPKINDIDDLVNYMDSITRFV